MAAGILSECLGFVRFTGATGAVLQMQGCISAVVRNGAGDYQIATEAIDSTEFACNFWIEDAAAVDSFVRSMAHTSDTSKQFLCVNAANGAADPTTVCLRFFRVGYGR